MHCSGRATWVGLQEVGEGGGMEAMGAGVVAAAVQEVLVGAETAAEVEAC